jgi:hypothetical protein
MITLLLSPQRDIHGPLVATAFAQTGEPDVDGDGDSLTSSRTTRALSGASACSVLFTRAGTGGDGISDLREEPLSVIRTTRA